MMTKKKIDTIYTHFEHLERKKRRKSTNRWNGNMNAKKEKREETILSSSSLA